MEHARAQRRTGPPQARGGSRLRHGGAGDHAQRQRGAADCAARDRPEAGRPRRDHEPGLRPHARHLGSARAPRQDRSDEDRVPGADDEPVGADRPHHARDHAEDEDHPHLPHHQPDRAAVPGARHRADGAGARHPDDRRRRARLRALPVQSAGPRV